MSNPSGTDARSTDPTEHDDLDMLWIGQAQFRLDGTMFRVNQSMCNLLGRDADDIIGRNAVDLWPPELIGPEVDLVQRLLAGEQTMFVSERTFDRPDGTTWEGNLFMSIVRRDDEDPYLHFGAREARETAYRPEHVLAKEGDFGLTLDQMQVGTLVVGLDAVTLQVNKAACEIFLLSEEELLRTEITNLFHPDDVEEHIVQAIRAGSGEIDSWRSEYRMTRDGEYFWCHSFIAIVRDADGNPLHYVGQLLDIDDRKRAEQALAESQARYRDLTETLPIGVLEIDVEGLVLSANPAAADLVGRLQIEPGTSTTELIHPDDQADGWRVGLAAFSSRSDYSVEFRVQRPDRQTRWVRAKCRPRFDDDGRFVMLTATWEDTTDGREARQAAMRFAQLLEAITDVVAIADPAGQIVYLNSAGTDLLEPGTSIADGIALSSFFGDDGQVVLEEQALPTARRDETWNGNLVMRTSWRTWPVAASIVGHGEAGEGAEYITAILRDITEAKAAEQVLQDQASHDALTGLPNRRLLSARLAEALARSAHTGRTVGVLFVDLDHFKVVNDTWGHDVGDAVLIEAGRRICAAVRDGDMVARVGGDEFVVLCHELDNPELGLEVGERISVAMAERFEDGPEELRLGASVGVAVGDHTHTTQGLLRRADLALYAAKDAGRGVAISFTPELFSPAG